MEVTFDKSIIEWGSEPYFIRDLEDQFELPQVVRVSPEFIPEWNTGPLVNRENPFLVYSRRRRTKVYAECLFFKDDSKSMIVDGPVVEIPKDYPGWFEVMTENKKMPKACKTIEEISTSGCKSFLLRSTIVGFRFTKDTNDEISLNRETKLFPGEVIKVSKIISKKWKLKTDPLSTITTKEAETKFLQCVDGKQCDILIPLAHPGTFSPVYDKANTMDNSVCQVPEMLSMSFPLTIKLVFGWPPKCDFDRRFTGMFRLIGLNRPDTMVLCNITENRTALMELPMDAEIKFQRGVNEIQLKNDPGLKTIINKCYSKVYPFVICIKPMNIRYKKRAKLTTRRHSDDIHTNEHSTDHEQENAPGKTARMAGAVNMDLFDPLAIFPPLESPEMVSDSFKLSFKDPDNLLESNENLSAGMFWFGDTGSSSSEKMTEDSDDVKLKRGRPSVAVDNRARRQNGHGTHRRNDARAIRESNVMKKEANC